MPRWLRAALLAAFAVSALVPSRARAQSPADPDRLPPDSTVVVTFVTPGSPGAGRVAWMRPSLPSEPAHGHWFYQGLPYGSDALVHPVRLILDGGFGILQFDDHGNRLGDVRFRSGWHRVWADMGDPQRAVQASGGWSSFLKREVLPISANRRDAQYWPNYTLHLVGGGMSYTMMREWYAAHDFGHPRWMAGATLAAYHVLNEVVENDRRPGPTTDALADLGIFDPLSIVLFSHEPVNRFFGRTLHMRDWSTMPAVDPRTGAIENQGQNFSIKIGIPRSERWSLLYYFGNHGEVGLTYTKPNGSAFSLGGGLRAKDLVAAGQGSQTADLVPSYGFFYDRNGSLLFSVTSARTSRYAVRVNAYPGLLGFRGRTAGVFLLWNRDGEMIAGLHFVQFPIGIAGRR